MSIIVAYDKYQYNWYVGELYDAFAKHLQNLYTDIIILPIQELAKQNDEPFGFRQNSLSSIFNIYNLIVYNTITKVSFIHSLADYAPVFLEHESALHKLNTKVFAFSSNFTQEIKNKYQNFHIKVIPSFYILENLNDLNYINQYSDIKNKINQCYFNGLCYGHRQYFIDCLKQNSFFVMKNKSNPNEFLAKPQYYEELSKFRYGLSLNGAAQICYRDLEYFGTKTLCLREPLNIITNDPISPDIHYKSIIDNNLYINIINLNNCNSVIDTVLDKISCISEEESSFIINNAYLWYINNATLNKQIQFLINILVQENIL